MLEKQHTNALFVLPSRLVGSVVRFLLVLLCISALLPRTSLAQVSSGGPCGCQPASWTFEIDFHLASCQSSSNAFDSSSGGIQHEQCELRNLTPNGLETTFVGKVSIRIVELDQELQQAVQQVFKTNVTHGDQIVFESILMTPARVDETSLPKAILVTINGQSLSGQLLRATWSLFFTNSCDVFPVVQGNEETILSRVTDITYSPRSLCPFSFNTD
ncbi:hypothetical protein ACA910_021364 [Epithemia clementina (nom. ined.)]